MVILLYLTMLVIGVVDEVIGLIEEWRPEMHEGTDEI